MAVRLEIIRSQSTPMIFEEQFISKKKKIVDLILTKNRAEFQN
jgi:hypothetical protein